MAVNNALQVISWHENLPEDELPPRHIWWSSELLDEWFRNVKEKRESKYGDGKRRTSYEDAEDVPMTSNEYVEGLRPDG